MKWWLTGESCLALIWTNPLRIHSSSAKEDGLWRELCVRVHVSGCVCLCVCSSTIIWKNTAWMPCKKECCAELYCVVCPLDVGVSHYFHKANIIHIRIKHIHSYTCSIKVSLFKVQCLAPEAKSAARKQSHTQAHIIPQKHTHTHVCEGTTQTQDADTWKTHMYTHKALWASLFPKTNRWQTRLFISHIRPRLLFLLARRQADQTPPPTPSPPFIPLSFLPSLRYLDKGNFHVLSYTCFYPSRATPQMTPVSWFIAWASVRPPGTPAEETKAPF